LKLNPTQPCVPRSHVGASHVWFGQASGALCVVLLIACFAARAAAEMGAQSQVM